jgi:predicted nucleic acid-binding protein
MSLKVVLDKETWVDALTNDTYGFLRALIDICDQIVVNKNILQEYGEISALLPIMESLAQRQPKQKIIKPKMDPPLDISIPRYHRRLIKGAIRAQADILILNIEIRGKWENLAQELERLQLRIFTPEQYVQYVSERGKPNRS